MNSSLGTRISLPFRTWHVFTLEAYYLNSCYSLLRLHSKLDFLQTRNL